MTGRSNWRRAALAVALMLVVTACGDDGGEAEEPTATEEADGGSDPEATEEPEDAEGAEGEAAGGEFVEGVLQPLDSGFPDSELTLLVIDEAGSDDGIYARQVQEVASEMSPVPINVLDRPDFGQYGTWEGLVWMSEQDRGDEGYIAGVTTIPGATGDLISTPVRDELGVEAEDLNFVLGTESLPYVIASRPDMPWGTDFRAMLEYAAENPGEVRYLSRGPGSGVNIALQQYAQYVGATFETAVGGSHVEILTALGAGATDIAVTLPGQVGPFLEDERLVILACSGRNDPCEGPWDRDDVPTMASQFDEVESDPWGSTRALFVTPETPEENRQWLETLMRAVAEHPDFVEARQTSAGTDVEIWTSDELHELQQMALVESEPILEEAGLLYESGS